MMERAVQLLMAGALIGAVLGYYFGGTYLDFATMIVGGSLIGILVMEVEYRMEKSTAEPLPPVDEE